MDRDDIALEFLDTLPFEPYEFQEEAIMAWFECDGGLLVTAPTGMGKTLIAETAVFEALKTGKRCYYTTPLIALTDQKLEELQDRAAGWGFSRDDIGLLTGNRKLNPDAPVLVVVAEILLNHLLDEDRSFDNVASVVMDEFHWFNDRERGVVWELSLTELPDHVRVLLLSATVGNAPDFVIWLHNQVGRTLRHVHTDERKVPLDFAFVEDKLLTEQLVEMVGTDDASARVPALVFCFARDACWEMAERLKGLPLISKETQATIQAILDEEDLSQGIGPKLRQMLLRGVGVHHAGVLPKHKALVERLFTEKLMPFVICTETLAAGVNLPARSVVLSTILKGPPKDKKVLPSSDAHQMFGRAGRPQFDTQGYVYCVAHDDDVKIWKWKQKYDALPAKAKDPTILRARKQLERKRPKRRTTEQYWTEGQFRNLIEAGPARLASRAMIPYRFLVYLLLAGESPGEVRGFLSKRFNSVDRLTGFENELDGMLANLVALGYGSRTGEEPDAPFIPDERLERLLAFRSVDPLFGDWLVGELAYANAQEKLLAIESVLFVPHRIARSANLPLDLAKGPLQQDVLEPLMLKMGIGIAPPEPPPEEEREEKLFGFEDEPPEPPPQFPDMLRIAFEAKLAVPEELEVQTKWIAGGILEGDSDLYKFTGARHLAKNEGLIMRHLLRVVLLAHEFHELTDDPDYELLGQQVTEACEKVDPRFTRRMLERTTKPDELAASRATG